MSDKNLELAEPTKEPPVNLGRLSSTTGFLIRRLHVLLSGSWSADIAPSEIRITPVQAGVLVLISENPNVTQSRLLQALDVEPPTLFRSVSQLEDLGLIDKVRSKSDKRVFHINLTDKGRSAVAEVEERMAAREERLSRPIDKQEFEVFTRVLKKLIAERSKSATWLDP